MEQQRRKVIQGGLSLLSMIMLPGCGGTSSTSKKVIVVGSGISGLAAARDLVSAGYDVTIIEAQNRTGGRLKTDTTLSTPLDLGASWIHGVEGNPITELATACNATLLETKYSNSILYDSFGAGFDLTNTPISPARKNTLDALETELKTAITSGQQANSDTSIYTAIWNGTNAANKSAGDQHLLKFLMSSKLETEYAGAGTDAGVASVGDLSTYYYDSVKTFSGADKVFTNGYGQIADYLAKNLTIKTNEKVTAIDYSNASVSVTTDKGNYTADKVLVTVPLGVLKKNTIAFTPALPSTHTDAINQIGMGLLNKLYLEFDSSFWKSSWGGNNYDWIESIPDAGATEQRWTEWVSFDNAANKPILLGFSAATAAESLETLTNDDIKADAMARLRSIFGNAIPDPKPTILRTKWASDTYTYGSYSFNKVGMKKTVRQDLATPINNRLYFAGEATHQDYFGTVHGAYLSGQAAATLIKS